MATPTDNLADVAAYLQALGRKVLRHVENQVVASTLPPAPPVERLDAAGRALPDRYARQKNQWTDTNAANLDHHARTAGEHVVAAVWRGPRLRALFTINGHGYHSSGPLLYRREWRVRFSAAHGCHYRELVPAFWTVPVAVPPHPRARFYALDGVPAHLTDALGRLTLAPAPPRQRVFHPPDLARVYPTEKIIHCPTCRDYFPLSHWNGCCPHVFECAKCRAPHHPHDPCWCRTPSHPAQAAATRGGKPSYHDETTLAITFETATGPCRNKYDHLAPTAPPHAAARNARRNAKRKQRRRRQGGTADPPPPIQTP